MRIIRSYILRECIIPFFMALVVLTCVFLLGNLIQLTNLVINKGVSLTTVGRAFLLMIPVFLGYTIPIACLISVITAFSRFSADNEIIALRASGIHLGRLLIPLIILGFIASLFLVVLNERIIPYAHHEQRRVLKNLGAENPTAMLEAGMFIHAFENQIIFIHKINGNQMYNITIYQPQPDGPTRTIIAKRGEFTPVPGGNQIKLKLIDGTSDEPNLENPENFYKLNFKNYFMTLDLSKNKKKIEKKPQSMTFKELKTETAKLERLFVDTIHLRTEYFRKITWSFSPLIFILIGFPLAVITNRRERSANIVLAILCFAFYYLISIGCEALSKKGILPPALIMWAPNMIAATSALILNYKCVF
ncbi:MAG: LPS export ABC transporter permease LptF [Candidatus Omnitrophica bacterium]|nr:LPS export ABC transporter permease LptF [Candidatus Omnitrophota bacterium]